jgi:hypothetical protein
MLLGPDEIAQRIQHRHRPDWMVWFGRSTRHYWALAAWVRTPDGMLGAATPDALEVAITTFERLHPKPTLQHAHAVDH